MLVSSFAMLVAACKAPRAGDRCSGAGQCVDGNAALICREGVLVAATCDGAGCQKSPFRCDYRREPTGAACFEAMMPSPKVCSEDAGARVRCVRGAVERDECDGPSGCHLEGTQTIACEKMLRAGAHCGLEGDWCAQNEPAWLECRKGTLAVAARCRGPAGCQPFGGTIACDTSIGADGDPCIGATKSCSANLRSVLACVDGMLKVETTCREGTACAAGKGVCQ